MTLRSPSFPDGLPAYGTEAEARASLSTWDVIRNSAPVGMSDEQQDNEHTAMKRWCAAVLEFRNALNFVNDSSVLVQIDRQVWEDFLHDECPSVTNWDEAISLARRG